MANVSVRLYENWKPRSSILESNTHHNEFGEGEQHCHYAIYSISHDDALKLGKILNQMEKDYFNLNNKKNE